MKIAYLYLIYLLQGVIFHSHFFMYKRVHQLRFFNIAVPAIDIYDLAINMVIFLQTVGLPVNHTFFGVDISWDMMRMDINYYIDMKDNQQNRLLSLLIGGLTSSNMFFKTKQDISEFAN